MTPKDKEELMKGVEWKPFNKVPYKGGQMAGFPPGHYGARLVHEELGFEVACNYHGSQTSNKEMCINLFELFLLEAAK